MLHFTFFFFFRKLKITTNKNFFVRKYFGIEGGYEQIYFVPRPESELFPTQVAYICMSINFIFKKNCGLHEGPYVE